MSAEHFQIVVVGSGFGGSLCAMIAHRLGFSTALIERGRHPRFAIGESSTPLANLLLEELATEYDLPFVRPLCKWGAWQRHCPHLGCGLKRGFTFYHHEFGQRFSGATQRKKQLLVGASPNEDIADTHWYRPDFDHYLVQQAQTLGVTYWDETALTAVEELSDGLRLSGSRDGKSIEITANLVIDATGPRGFLQGALGLKEKPLTGFPSTQGLFSHFRNFGSLPAEFIVDGLTTPYPPEQAAVHHVFSGGWVWVLKFNNGITSAGVAATDAVADALKFKEGEAAWRRLLLQVPSLAEACGRAEAIMPFVYSPRLSFRSETVTGSSWALLPSAAGFVDPLLSTGFPLTLLGVKRLGGLLRSHATRSSLGAELEGYSRQTLLEVDTAAQLVGALYANMDRFDVFKELSLLYFVAASFSETARRLGKSHLADSFLLCRHPVFGKQLRQICAAARSSLSVTAAADLRQQIHNAIEPFDVAGLADESRDPWYPCAVADLFRNAAKVEASETEISTMLRRCGLT